jgi:dTDP-4-dehydrorhamnose reductase
MFLLIGGDSEIGAATARHLLKSGYLVAATTRRPEYVSSNRPFLDLSSPNTGWEPPYGTHGVCICAAVSRVVDCEKDPIGSAKVNVTATVNLCEWLVARGIYVLLLSTNQVFDGRAPHVLAEAPTCPVTEYGRQKAQTEAALRIHIAKGAPAAILRLARVVSPDFLILCNWISLLSRGMPIRAFHDMTLAPTPIEIVAKAITCLLDKQARGIFQLTGPRDVSYEALGRHVARRVGADASLVHVESTQSAGLPEGTARPHTTLDSTLLNERYGLTVPDAWVVLDEVISGHLQQSPNPASCARNVR